MRTLIWSIACVLLLVAASAAAQTRVYLTEGEALERLLRNPESIRQLRVSVSEQQAIRFEDELGISLAKREYVFHEATGEDGVIRRAVIMDVIGEYRPITFAVAMLPRGVVEGVEIMVYRESRGSEVRRGAFLKQFEEKSLKQPVALHRDIDGITGATLSSRAVTGGVRLALVLNARLEKTKRR